MRRRFRQSHCLISLLLIFAGCGSESVPDQQASTPTPSPAVASVGDSTFTLARLEAWLEATPESLSRSEIESFLTGWVEGQVYLQAAHQAGLLEDARIREQMAAQLRHFARGLLEESILARPIEISEREMKRWARANPERLTLKERQIKLAWYASEDSLQLADIAASLARNALRADQLSNEGLAYGKTPFITESDLDARISARIFAMEYLDISPVVLLDDQFILYQVVGNRPKGYLLPVDSAEGEVLQWMEDERRAALLKEELARLREAARWSIDLDVLDAADAAR
jgi:hypothetical protein